MNRFRWVVVSVVAVAVITGVAIGVAYYVINDSLTHPHEQTAKYLPPDTQFYMSVNLRPGVGQLSKLKTIYDKFDANDKFGERIDKLFEEIEDESRIDTKEDLLPWLGPEIAVALLDFDVADESVDFVAFIGTTDTEATTVFLDGFLEYIEIEEGTGFTEGSHQGYVTYDGPVDSGDINAHFVVTDDYLLFATTRELLESTVDMIDASGESLADNPDFISARDSVDDSRFAFLYASTDRIVDTISSSFGLIDNPVLDETLFEEIESELPGFVSASASFIDQGIKMSTSFKTPDDAPGVNGSNPLAAADYLPGDTLALISTGGVQELWDEFKEQIGSDAELSFDQGLQDFNDEFGLDIERDLVRWMTGEVAFALLPTNLAEDVPVLNALALAEFNDREATDTALENIVDSLECQGLDIDRFRLGDIQAVTVDLENELGDSEYEPGYFVLSNYVVLGTTRESLRKSAAANAREIESLSQSPSYCRARNEIDGELDYLVYASIREIVEASLDAVSASERAEFRDNAAPFIDPIDTIMIGGGSTEELTTFTLILTFD